MAETRSRGFGHGPSRKQAIKKIDSFYGEEIERSTSGKIESQERLLVTVNGYSGPEVGR